MPADKLYCLTMDYPPLRGGVARYLYELAKASHGQMSVLVPLEHPQDARDVIFAKFWWSGWPKWLPLIERCLEIKDGIIFVSHIVPVGTAAWISNLLGGPDYIVLFHGTDLQRMKTPWKRWLLRRICRRSRLLVTNSQATADVLRKLVPNANPLVLTPGVVSSCHCEEEVGRLTKQSVADCRSSTELSRMSATPNFARNDTKSVLGIPETTKIILTVCRLVERKGIDTLIQAMAELQGNRDVRLVVVGNGPYAQTLHRLAELLEVSVTWIQDATDEQVGQWYAAADIFCLPARETPDDVEGFGIVLLEAAAAGLPVVAGRGWGTAEAVQDGVTGLLVQPSVGPVMGALRKLLDDDGLRQKMGRAGQERVKKDFRWEDRWERLKQRITKDEERRTHLQEQEPVVKDAKDVWDVGAVSDIAVVIPCYNHAVELVKTLQSLVNQTLQPEEIVVMDDGSIDEPGKVVAGFKEKLNITCHKLPNNQGAPAARNQGADLTTAPYLLFLDADVELKPKALEVLRRKLEKNSDAAFAYSDFFWKNRLFHGRTWDADALRRLNWIHTSSLMRREAFPRFDESLKKFQDWDLWLTMAEHGQKGVWVDEPLFRVTERKMGISRWLPSFMHRLPWPILGWMPQEIKRYREAEAIIRRKHKL